MKVHKAAPAAKSVPATKSALRGSQSAAPATNSALRGSQNAAPATKSALRGSQSAVPVTTSALPGSQSAEICTLRFMRRCACHEMCTSRFTRRSPAIAFRRKNASKDNTQIPKRSFRAKLPQILRPQALELGSDAATPTFS